MDETSIVQMDVAQQNEAGGDNLAEVLIVSAVLTSCHELVVAGELLAAEEHLQGFPPEGMADDFYNPDGSRSRLGARR